MKGQSTKADPESASSTVRLRRRPGHVATFRNSRGEALEPSSVSASQAKSEFGRVLEIAIQGGAVVITKHDAPRAVLISVENFNALSGAAQTKLDTLSRDQSLRTARLQNALPSLIPSLRADALAAATPGKSKRTIYDVEHTEPDSYQGLSVTVGKRFQFLGARNSRGIAWIRSGRPERWQPVDLELLSQATHNPYVSRLCHLT